jgi:hypothetical protein
MNKILALSFVFVACGRESVITVHNPMKPTVVTETNGSKYEGKDLSLCAPISNTVLQCTDPNGGLVQFPLPPSFPNLKDCNKCLTKITGNVAQTTCPNGLNFQFTLIKGDKGDTGAKGDKGDTGAKGDKGDSCTVSPDGWVTCGQSSYKLLQGPKGDKGDTGAAGKDGKDGVAGVAGKDGKDGIGCTTGTDQYGRGFVQCGTTITYLNGCGGGGCWSFGARGNVYRLPTNTQSLPDFSTMTPVATATTDDFSEFSVPYNPGMPWTFTNGFTDKEWFGVEFSGYIDIPQTPNNTVVFRLTSDDGSRFLVGNTLIEVIAMPNLQSPASKTGTLLALPGRHFYKLQWFQGPRVLVALALEMSVDGGNTFTTVPQESLTFEMR